MVDSVLAAFKRVDIDGEGVISRKELTCVFRELQPSLEEEEIDLIMAVVDKGADGRIPYEEFLNWMFGDKAAPRSCKAPKVSIAEAARGVKSMAELLKVLQDGGCCNLQQLQDLGSLAEAVRLYEESGAGAGIFFSELLPFICDEAARFQALFPQPIALIDEKSSASARLVEWSQRQCLCILCNSFLCAWPSRTTSRISCEEDARLPSINFDWMFRTAGRTRAQAAKCQMFLHYIQKQRNRLAKDGEAALQRPVQFLRAGVGPQGTLPEPSWCESAAPLCKMQVRPLRSSIDAAKDMLRADFANELIGGGSIGTGCVQEEIMFACHPELNCTRLVFPVLLKNEAIVLHGGEQFAEPTGYASGLGCGGAYDDPTPAGQGGILESHVTAIDAVDYRYGGKHLQYSQEGVSRELLKAYAGFAPPLTLGAPKILATGNWGAGAFAGDAQLKVLIQWAAASQAGISEMHYFPFDRADLLNALPKLDEGLREKGVTVGKLCSWLQRELDKRAAAPSIFEQVDKKFGTSCFVATSDSGSMKIGDSVPVPDKGTAKIIEMTTTDALLQFRDGSKKWYDVEDLDIMLSKKITASDFNRGDSVHVPGRGTATVLEATTTDAQLQFPDGSSAWHDVEDLSALLRKAITHKIRRGDTFTLPEGEAKVIESTMTDVQLEFADGSKKWYDVQDWKRVVETTVQSAVGNLKCGDKVRVPDRGAATIIQMTTTDVQILLLDGSKKWYDIEDLTMMVCESINSSVFKPGDALHVPGKGKAIVIESTTTDAQLKFGDGSSMWQDVEDLTKLLHQSISHELRGGDTVQFPGRGEAKVLGALTTDLQLEFADGSKAWYDVEDLKELLDQKLDDALSCLKRGDTVKVPTKGTAKVEEMTTTDVKLRFESGPLQGNRKWYDMEDLSTMISKYIVAFGFTRGDVVDVPGKGKSKVIECTTTDVQLELEDGSTAWYDVEDLINLAYDTISHDLRSGDTVTLPGNEEVTVTDNTTTDVRVMFRDGSQKSYDIEDFEKLLKSA